MSHRKEHRVPGPPSNNLSLDGLRLTIRPSVAVRNQTTYEGVLFYLSLLDDEIDDRFETFLALRDIASRRAAVTVFDKPTNAASELELTDALVFHGYNGTTSVIRGASCTFPLYWSSQIDCLQLSTVLPVAHGAKFSKRGFASAIAVVCLQGSHEPNACDDTPLQGWRRLRRGTITTFVGGSVCEGSSSRIAMTEQNHTLTKSPSRSGFRARFWITADLSVS